MAVLIIRVLPFEVYIRAPAFWKLPFRLCLWLGISRYFSRSLCFSLAQAHAPSAALLLNLMQEGSVLWEDGERGRHLGTGAPKQSM